MGKRKLDNIRYDPAEESDEQEDKSHLPPLTRKSDKVYVPKRQWTNKQRVLVICSRGLNARERHLVNDLVNMMPHTKTEPKFDLKSDLKTLNEVVESRNCNKIMYFETRKCTDLFMWLADVNGCSIKFQVLNVHTMRELKMTGNCLKGSRPVLQFSMEFNDENLPYLRLMKEMLVQTFGTPRFHSKSQPFSDHVFHFTYLDNKIWFRNYKVLQEDGELAEIGPRFVLNPVKILSNSFSGKTWYENPKFKTPNKVRQFQKRVKRDDIYSSDRQVRVKRQRMDLKPWKEEVELQEIFGTNDIE